MDGVGRTVRSRVPEESLSPRPVISLAVAARARRRALEAATTSTTTTTVVLSCRSRRGGVVGWEAPADAALLRVPARTGGAGSRDAMPPYAGTKDAQAEPSNRQYKCNADKAAGAGSYHIKEAGGAGAGCPAHRRSGG